MKDRITRFMIGRNGNDQLNLFLLIAALVSLLAGGIFRGFLGSLLRILALVLLVLVYFRMFSKDLPKRSEENSRYLQIRYRIFAKLKALKERWVQRKDFKFFQYSAEGFQILPVPVLPCCAACAQRQGKDQNRLPEVRKHLHREVLTWWDI